jgi:hypothetical protein
MGAFTSLNIAQKDIINHNTNEGIIYFIRANDNIVKSSDTSDENLTKGGKILLRAISYNANTPDLESNPIAVDASKVIVKNIIEGTLTPETLGNYDSYDNNVSLSSMNNNVGQTADNINKISDTQTESKLKSGDPQFAPTVPASQPTGNTQREGLISTITSPEYYASIMNSYVPKYNFLYVVSITLYDEYQADMPTSFSFLIKKFDKPKTTFEYEEVNMYNFRTQVPKRATFNPVHLEVFNDIKNESLNFIVAYLRRICPIFSQSDHRSYELSGMAFDNASSSYGLYTTNNNVNIIEQIDIYDIYAGNKTMDVYSLYNPKITDLAINDWNMEEANNVSIITLELVYDGWNLDVGVPAAFPSNIISMPDLAPSDSPEAAQTPGSKMDSKYTNLLQKSSDPSERDQADPAETYKEPVQKPEDKVVADPNITKDEVDDISDEFKQNLENAIPTTNDQNAYPDLPNGTANDKLREQIGNSIIPDLNTATNTPASTNKDGGNNVTIFPDVQPDSQKEDTAFSFLNPW